MEGWETAQDDCDAVGEFLKHNYLPNPVRNYLRTHNLNVISRAEFSNRLYDLQSQQPYIINLMSDIDSYEYQESRHEGKESVKQVDDKKPSLTQI